MNINDSHSRVLGQLQSIIDSKGKHELSVNKTTGELSTTSGDVSTPAGWVISCIRSPMQYVSSYTSDCQSVAAAIQGIIISSEALATDPALSPEQATQLKSSLVDAGYILRLLSSHLYTGDSKSKFNKLAGEIESISEKILTPEKPQDKNNLMTESMLTESIANWDLVNEDIPENLQTAEEAFASLDNLTQSWTDLNKSWLEMSVRADGKDVDKTQNWNFQEKQENLLGKIGRTLNTFRTWLTVPQTQTSQSTKIPAPWEQFGSTAVNSYMESLARKKVLPFNTISEFYMSPTLVNERSKDDILSLIDKKIIEFDPSGHAQVTDPLVGLLPDEKEPGDESPHQIGPAFDKAHPLAPICIPMVLGGKEGMGRNHIVAIIIKDGAIEYFDSMGVPSDKQVLADGSSLQDVLKACQEKYRLKEIHENRIQIQTDIHNCGVFVSDFFRRRIEKGELMGSMKKEMNNEELFTVRKEILQDVINYYEKVYKSMTQQKLNDSTEFSMDAF